MKGHQIVSDKIEEQALVGEDVECPLGEHDKCSYRVVASDYYTHPDNPTSECIY